jgi:phage/plasmid-like protein (TIGR03299 family)
MAHMLEVSPDSFETAFAARGVPGWHNLGTVFDADKKVTTADMLKMAKLNGWKIDLVPVSDGFPGLNFVENPFLVVRNNPFTRGQKDVLGSVGERYKVLQNEDLFDFGDAMLDGGGKWETAGSIKGGRVVFGSLLIDQDEITIDAKGAADKVKMYLLVFTSHNGSVSITAMITPTRVVCQNTLNMAVSGAQMSFKFRHTQNHQGRVSDAKTALSITHKTAEVFRAECEALSRVKVTDQEFFTIVSQLLPAPDADAGKRSQTVYANNLDTIAGVWKGQGRDGAPDTLSTIKGTAWGALNALTEIEDWYRAPRKGNAAPVLAAQMGFDPNVQNTKRAIKSAVLTFAREKSPKVFTKVPA